MLQYCIWFIRTAANSYHLTEFIRRIWNSLFDFKGRRILNSIYHDLFPCIFSVTTHALTYHYLQMLLTVY